MKETREKLLREIELLNSSHVATKRHRQSSYLNSKERGLAEKNFNLSNPYKLLNCGWFIFICWTSC